MNINIVDDNEEGTPAQPQDAYAANAEAIPMANMQPGEEQKLRGRRKFRAFLKAIQNRSDADAAPAEGAGASAGGDAQTAGGEETSSPHNEPRHVERESGGGEKERVASSRARSASKTAAVSPERRMPSARSAGGERPANRAEEDQQPAQNKRAWNEDADVGSSEV